MFIKVAGEKKEYPEGLTVKELIEKENFIVSYVCDWDCPVFFPKNGVQYVFRISPHYYTSNDDIQAICNLIQRL